MPSTAAMVLSWRAIGESAKPSSRRVAVADRLDRVRRADRLEVHQHRLAGEPDERGGGQPQPVHRDRLGAGRPQLVDHRADVAVVQHRDLRPAAWCPAGRSAAVVGAGGSSSSIRTPGPVTGDRPGRDLQVACSSVAAGRQLGVAQARPPRRPAPWPGRPAESPVCCSRWIRLDQVLAGRLPGRRRPVLLLVGHHQQQADRQAASHSQRAVPPAAPGRGAGAGRRPGSRGPGCC